MKTTRLRRGFTATSVAAVLLGAGLGCRNDPPVEVNKLSPGEKPPAPPALVAAGTPPPPAPAVLEPAPPPSIGRIARGLTRAEALPGSSCRFRSHLSRSTGSDHR